MNLILLQTTETGIISLVRDLGFPIATALLLGFFAWRNWQYTIKKIDEKDVIISQMTIKNEEVSERIILTQQNISTSLTRLTEIIGEAHYEQSERITKQHNDKRS